MKFLKNLHRKMNTTRVIYHPHPHRAGYAQLANKKQISLVKQYGYSHTLDSKAFEEFQNKVSKENIDILWIPKSDFNVFM